MEIRKYSPTVELMEIKKYSQILPHCRANGDKKTPPPTVELMEIRNYSQILPHCRANGDKKLLSNTPPLSS